MPGSIFLSHSSADTERVRELNRDLVARGIQTWFDEAELRPGDGLLERIRHAIRETSHTGVVLTPRSVQSDWVTREVEKALTKDVGGKRFTVIPLLLENCEMPRSLENIKGLDFRRESKFSYQRNLDVLVGLLHGMPIPPEWSKRRIFLDKLGGIPADARVFTAEFQKSEVERIANEMYDSHFDSLHDLGTRYQGGTRGITESGAVDQIMRPSKQQVRHSDEARPIFRALIDEGFFRLSRDPQEARHPDPGYDYTDQFFDFINLMRYIGVGALDESNSQNAGYFPSSGDDHSKASA
jgi:hypothetical protein